MVEKGAGKTATTAAESPPKRFAFYDNLSRKNQAEYRRSDALVSLKIPDVYPLRGFLFDIQEALEVVDTKRLRRLTQQMTGMLLEQFGAPPVEVRVLKVRPNDDEYELHGLYEHEPGKRPVIRVWAKTSAHKRPVAFKTFVRTLLHEVAHHLDFSVMRFQESFHTHGFYKRESHLVRQLFDLEATHVVAPSTVGTVVKKLAAKSRPRETQLSLFAPPPVEDDRE